MPKSEGIVNEPMNNNFTVNKFNILDNSISMKLEDHYAAEKKIFSALRDAGFKLRVIFDVGASHTPWSHYVSPIFPEATFYLFEPLVDVKPYYLQECQIAVKEHPNFQLLKIALGEVTGSVKMFSDSTGIGASILAENTSPELSEEFTVKVSRIDELIASKRLPQPDLLKMDVQGAELQVLRGAGRYLDRVQVIQAETWLVRGYGPKTPLFHELTQFLTEKGFAIVDIGERFYSSSHEFYAFDAFFARRDLLTQLGEKLSPEPLS